MVVEKMTTEGITRAGMLEWAYSGVDFSLAGNGGKDCVDFLGLKQRIIESILVCLFSCYLIKRGISKMTLPHKDDPQIGRKSYCRKQILLVIMCLTFGIELGFKFATKQMIYLLNPCHVVTIIQVSLLIPYSIIIYQSKRIYIKS